MKKHKYFVICFNCNNKELFNKIDSKIICSNCHSILRKGSDNEINKLSYEEKKGLTISLINMAISIISFYIVYDTFIIGDGLFSKDIIYSLLFITIIDIIFIFSTILLWKTYKKMIISKSINVKKGGKIVLMFLILSSIFMLPSFFIIFVIILLLLAIMSFLGEGYNSTSNRSIISPNKLFHAYKKIK